MKYRSKKTGAILEPRSEMVAEQFAKSEDYEVFDEAVQNGEKPLSRMNKPELLAAAAEAGITVPDGATNPEIVELIKAAREQ